MYQPKPIDRLHTATGALSCVMDLLANTTADDMNVVNPHQLYKLLDLIMSELRAAETGFEPPYVRVI